MVDLRIFIAAAVLFAVGIGLHVWSTGRDQVGRRHTFRIIVLLCYALGATVLTYSLFPQSDASGTVLGFTLGGASAFIIVIMLLAMRWWKPADQADQHEREVANLSEEIERLQQRLAVELEHLNPVTLTETERYEYRLRAEREYTVGVLTGDLANVRGIDVWVNSENTNMEMSRAAEPTISGLIRYYGGRRDDGGFVVDDVIHTELQQRMAGRTSIMPASVLTTGAGELTASHGVQLIVHVAAVEATPVAGFRQVVDVRRCLVNVLAEIDRLNRAGRQLRSVAIPLLGTGVAGADVKSTAGELANALVAYLRSAEDSPLTTAYLLARTDVQREILTAIFDAKPELTGLSAAS